MSSLQESPGDEPWGDLAPVVSGYDYRDSRKLLASSRPTEELPTLGHAVLFFLIALPLLAGGQYLAIYAAERIHLFGRLPMAAYLELAASDARLGLPSQAFAYLLVALCAGVCFSWVWQRPFLEGLHFRPSLAAKRAAWLILLGLAGGAMTSLIGAVLPMPKDPPILEDMMQSPAGAWLMLIFGVTFAPALEEMAFRGFLLPGFVHAFDWLVRKGDIQPSTRRWVGIPVSIVLTSLPFALMHGQQVSHAWGPLLLIGLISVLLCVVRLALDSLAASMIVHAAYNLTLFAGILYQTVGFRHLDKLAN